ncbi:MAG: hypothetical protein GY870_19815 [archaeon]|nr:hypothetical protein [archaeon]
MTNCPECTGDMDFSRGKHICKACGASYSKDEIEDYHEDLRYGETSDEKKKRELQEYKDWYFKKKK